MGSHSVTCDPTHVINNITRDKRNIVAHEAANYENQIRNNFKKTYNLYTLSKNHDKRLCSCCSGCSKL